MIKKYIREIFLCTSVFLTYSILNLLQFIVFQFSTSNKISFDMIIENMMAYVPHVFSIIVFVVVISICHRYNNNNYKTKEVLLFIGIFLVIISISDLLHSVLNIYSFISLLKHIESSNYLIFPRITFLIFDLIELSIGVIILVAHSNKRKVLNDSNDMEQ